MKRILMLLCSLLISLNIAADGHITEIQKLIADGDYETAKRKITHYQKVYPKEFTEDVVAFWMQKCDDGIAKKNRDEEIKVAKAKAKRKEEEKRKQEAKLERERQQKEEARKQNKLVYISVETDIPGLEKKICSLLSAGEEKILTTSIIDDALWELKIKTSEKIEKKNNNFYRLVLRADIEILNLLTNEYLYEKVLTTEESRLEIKIGKERASKSIVDSIKSFIIDDNICKKITQYK